MSESNVSLQLLLPELPEAASSLFLLLRHLQIDASMPQATREKLEALREKYFSLSILRENLADQFKSIRKLALIVTELEAKTYQECKLFFAKFATGEVATPVTKFEPAEAKTVKVDDLHEIIARLYRQQSPNVPAALPTDAQPIPLPTVRPTAPQPPVENVVNTKPKERKQRGCKLQLMQHVLDVFNAYPPETPLSLNTITQLVVEKVGLRRGAAGGNTATELTFKQRRESIERNLYNLRAMGLVERVDKKRSSDPFYYLIKK